MESSISIVEVVALEEEIEPPVRFRKPSLLRQKFWVRTLPKIKVLERREEAEENKLRGVSETQRATLWGYWGSDDLDVYGFYCDMGKESVEENFSV